MRIFDDADENPPMISDGLFDEIKFDRFNDDECPDGVLLLLLLLLLSRSVFIEMFYSLRSRFVSSIDQSTREFSSFKDFLMNRFSLIYCFFVFEELINENKMQDYDKCEN